MIRDRNIYELIGLTVKWLLGRIFHLIWVFIRVSIYWIVRLLYKIFKLQQIDVERQRNKLESLDNSLNIKHEFTFPKSEKFILSWIYIKDLVFDLELDRDEKDELFDSLIVLVAEAERGAFNTTLDYIKTKDLKEPSFEDLCIQGIFKTDTNIEPRAKFENPFDERLSDVLRNKRHKAKDDKIDEAKARLGS